MLARSGAPRTFSEIAEHAGTPKATTHRILKTLEARGYVSQDPAAGRYAAGVRCFELGSLWIQNLDLRQIAVPWLQSLNDMTGETVHLGIYEYGDVVYIDRLECHFPVGARSYVGRRCPATCVATGRVLLAFAPHQEVERVLSQPLPAYTRRSITDPAQLQNMLSEVRAVGYGINHGSYRDEVSGIAAPIRDHTGAVIAAVGLCLPEHRFTKDRFTQLRDHTIAAAVEISAALGGPTNLMTGRPAPATNGVHNDEQTHSPVGRAPDQPTHLAGRKRGGRARSLDRL
jgi:Transcriptional regulator